MISAKEAVALANASTNNVMREIEEAIKDACSHSQYKCSLRMSVCNEVAYDSVMRQLKSNGYSVFHGARDKFSISIEWH